MAISPLMSFTKGAFEGYNQIQDEERALAAELKIENAKNGTNDTLASNYFSTMGIGGVNNWFELSDAKDIESRSERDLNMLAQTAVPEIMETLDDAERSQWEAKAVGMMQRYHETLLVRNKEGQIITTPNNYAFPELLRNDYTRDLWKSVLSGDYVFSKTAPNAKVAVNVNNSGDVEAEAINVDYAMYGMTEEEWDSKAREYAMIRGDDPNVAPANYSKNYKHQIFIHSSINPNNQNETMHEVFKRVVTDTAVNPEDIKSINDFRKNINRNNTLQIGNYEVFKALEFVAPTSHESEVPRTGSIQTIYKPSIYMDNILGIKPEQLREKRDAARQGQRIANRVLDEIQGYEAVYGTAAPATSFTSNVANFFAAFTGREGGVLQQLSFLKSSVLDNYGVEDDGAAGYVSEQYKIYQKAIKKAETLGDSQKIAAAKTGAVAQLYSIMLAYQLAVAIQGGTGGRTVSDQDVQNMQRAFGDRMFVNQKVQKHVVKEVDLFLQDIINATGYFTDTLNSQDLRGTMAANAHHKLYFGGLVGDDIDTNYMSDQLRDRVANAKILSGKDVKYTPEGNMIYNIGGKDGITVSDNSTYLDIYNDLKNDPSIKALNSDELNRYGLGNLFDTDYDNEEDAQFYLESIGSVQRAGDK